MDFLPWKAVAAVTVCILQTCLSAKIVETSLSDSDRIDKLPGQPEVSFQHFSGYITVDEKQERALFYYFVEAETDPASKPFVLWLNGGPGCSSVGVGAFSEHGPFRTSGDRLVRNEYSWNKEANMLYLEAPVGVGFSYSINTSNYVGVDDEITARDNLIFLQRWFVKFPEYKCRDLFVTGESYAGHYVPQLAQLILQFNKKEKLFNLKGILLGNPLLDFVTDFNSKAEFFCLLRSDENQVNNEISMYIDKYDVTIDVCLSSILSQSNALTHLQVAEKLDVCVEDETTKYFNRVDVQKALHARLLGVTSWVSCSDNLHYKKLNFEESMIPVVGSLISGDQDSVIPLTGTRTLLHGLANELGLNTTTTYRAWFEGKQVGGWMQVYGNILSFATIRGASHKAPFSQPERSLVLFNAFLKGKPLPEEFRAIE
ncbi:serine carboxypeptidase-like 45 isoform X2 [Macadamia integrifolia]|uniref:serine carboxypeptidase-like 45 isoform X2 n=1 Tax=Macadamia integrifolia TaxID=60698 RepID=UPI001C52A4CF|nr:serine carboxypeptidase-like 45 isoform X2 [Macadamia integrifolia]